MRRRLVCIGFLSLIDGLAWGEARAQTDSIGEVFRDMLVDVAATSNLPRLDSTALSLGVRP